jgi:hypothetical protein
MGRYINYRQTSCTTKIKEYSGLFCTDGERIKEPYNHRFTVNGIKTELTYIMHLMVTILIHTSTKNPADDKLLPAIPGTINSIL